MHAGLHISGDLATTTKRYHTPGVEMHRQVLTHRWGVTAQSHKENQLPLLTGTQAAPWGHNISGMPHISPVPVRCTRVTSTQWGLGESSQHHTEQHRKPCWWYPPYLVRQPLALPALSATNIAKKQNMNKGQELFPQFPAVPTPMQAGWLQRGKHDPLATALRGIASTYCITPVG